MRQLLLLWPLLLNACAPAPGAGSLSYAEAPDGTLLTLEAVTPDGDGPFPTIIYVHGGGWTTGDASSFTAYAKRAAERGFASINLNYRLAIDAHGNRVAPWPAQAEDVRCAVRWLAANAATYGVDVARVAIVGDSAGGHLAMIQAYGQLDPRFDADFCTNPGTVDIKAVTSFYGVSDVPTAYTRGDWFLRPVIATWLDLPAGARLEDHRPRFDSANPTHYAVSGSKVPTLIIQGMSDTLVVPFTQEVFSSAARAAGVDVTLEYVSGGHGLDDFQGAHERMLSWLEGRL